MCAECRKLRPVKYNRNYYTTEEYKWIKQGRQAAQASETALGQKQQPRSLAISRQGIKTGADFANLMSALISDIIEGTVTPIVGNAVVNAGGKLLKVVEMQYKYGRTPDGQGQEPKVLILAPGEQSV